MTDTSQSPFPFEGREENQFRDESIVSCCLRKLLQFAESRNVWGTDRQFSYGRWGANRQATYPGFDSFGIDLRGTKEKIERLRKPGSQWTIWELPAVVVSGAESSLLITEINTYEPLSKFLPLNDLRLRLESVGQYFASSDSVARVICPAALVRPATLPFDEHHSQSRGGNHRLSWSQDTPTMNIEAVLRMVCEVNRLLQATA
jgi:hypothetical protein